MPTSSSTTKNKRSSRSKKSASSTGSSKSADKTADGSSIGSYATAQRWLLNHNDHERMRIVRYNDNTFSLERMRKLLAGLGDPQDCLRCVQVAGTKGKGSTCAMIASMLQACGYAVGLYTSPHLVDVRERITINGQLVTQNDLTELFRQIEQVEAKMDEPLTYFEILTGAALRYYADQAVDVVVLETGLGGRLDSTTAVTPLVCGLAHISHDHTNILGKDLASIAREKAGIFKPGVPAISVEQAPEVEAVLVEVAEQTNTPLEFTGREIDFSYRFEANRELGPHTRVSVTTPTSRWEHLAVPLPGEHQAHNCGLALGMLDKLKAHGFEIPEEKAIAGLAATKLEGRMEQVFTEPRVMIDGAHNAVSIQALIRSLGAHVQYDSLVVIFGCAQDKDIDGMLKQLSLGADKIVFTRARSNPRAVEPEDLLQRFGEVCGKMAQVAPTLPEALKLGARAVSREDLILVTGSFYLVGEAKKYFIELQNKKKR